MNEKLITTVKGHCSTWHIYETENGFYKVCNKQYSTIKKAHWAIRIAEYQYLKANPNAPLVNADIWADHDILWCDDFDGNYYN